MSERPASRLNPGVGLAGPCCFAANIGCRRPRGVVFAPVKDITTVSTLHHKVKTFRSKPGTKNVKKFEQTFALAEKYRKSHDILKNCKASWLTYSKHMLSWRGRHVKFMEISKKGPIKYSLRNSLPARVAARETSLGPRAKMGRLVNHMHKREKKDSFNNLLSPFVFAVSIKQWQ